MTEQLTGSQILCRALPRGGRGHDVRVSRRRDHAVLSRAARVSRAAPHPGAPRAGGGARGGRLRPRVRPAGVCVATSGPGATNLVTGLATAHMDNTPVVAITGQVSRAMIGRDAFQETDIIGITQPITKHSVLVEDVERAGRGGARGVRRGAGGPARAGADRRAEGRAEPKPHGGGTTGGATAAEPARGAERRSACRRAGRSRAPHRPAPSAR